MGSRDPAERGQEEKKSISEVALEKRRAGILRHWPILDRFNRRETSFPALQLEKRAETPKKLPTLP